MPRKFVSIAVASHEVGEEAVFVFAVLAAEVANKRLFVVVAAHVDRVHHLVASEINIAVGTHGLHGASRFWGTL